MPSRRDTAHRDASEWGTAARGAARVAACTKHDKLEANPGIAQGVSWAAAGEPPYGAVDDRFATANSPHSLAPSVIRAARDATLTKIRSRTKLDSHG
jgi:hypothetical protein